MRANEIVMTGKGGPEVLRMRTRELPAARDTEALVRVEATGVAFAEVQMLRGRYPGQPSFPFVPGYDLVGTVESVATNSHGIAVGTRVAMMTRTGGWADRVIAPLSTMVPVPDGLDPGDAVALVVNGVTAWQMLHRTAKVHKGQTVLVHGASGGVGMLLSQLAIRAGARVLGTASAAKHDALRAIEVLPIDYRNDDVPAVVRRLAPEGVDAVFDQVGGRSLSDSYRLLARGGTVIWYGSVSTLHDSGSPLRPFLGVLAKLGGWELRRLLGLGRGRRGRPYYVRVNDRFRADLTTVFQLANSGELTAPVAGRYPLADAADALRELADGRVTGKVVLTP
jgi:2-desacetyl-2-hydroxyethyl bacteriochlorophyllide A dehydrogenase